jgi:hypothetical protein
MFKSDEAEQSTQDNSTLNTVFFSSYDVGVTRTCFPAAYSIALVMGESLDGVQSWGLFGWHRGELQKRGCHVLDSGDLTTSVEPRRMSLVPATIEQDKTRGG